MEQQTNHIFLFFFVQIIRLKPFREPLVVQKIGLDVAMLRYYLRLHNYRYLLYLTLSKKTCINREQGLENERKCDPGFTQEMQNVEAILIFGDSRECPKVKGKETWGALARLSQQRCDRTWGRGTQRFTIYKYSIEKAL